MAQILNGEFVRNETNQGSMGGTEVMTMKLAEKLPKELLEKFQIVSSRVKSPLQEDKIRIFWAHDLSGDGENNFLKDKNERDKFHRFVFVSHWQMQSYIQAFNLPWSKCVVLQNAIETVTPSTTRPDAKEELNIIYTPTPHRGLSILIPVFEKLAEKHDHIHLHVFSSFALYGWEERDKEYEPIFEQMDKHPRIHNHGTQPNEVVREQLAKSHIFAYPSIWPETSCMCLMEAMASELVCVHSNFAALPETAANWTQMYQLHEDINHHAGLFYNYLDMIIDQYDTETIQSRLAPASNYANVFYTWPNRVIEWQSFLTMLDQSIDDTTFPKETFDFTT
jgi:glycosyltransferase involved in cell wall biosynthesis